MTDRPSHRANHRPEQPAESARAILMHPARVAGLVLLMLVPIPAVLYHDSREALAVMGEDLMHVALLYMVVLLGFRIIGKREFGELSPAELVTLLLIPEIASQAFDGQAFALSRALIGIATILVLVMATSVITHRFPKVEKALMGEAQVLVCRGRMLTRAMDLERISPDEIYAAMHQAGVESLREVRWAILESDGVITVIPEARQGAVSRQDSRPI